MKVAVVGATGLVGREMLKVLDQRKFRFDELCVVASERSVGKIISYQGKEYKVISLPDAVAAKPHIALFSAGGSVSLEWAPKFEAAGTVVIDNSSAWRMSPDHKLIVPEINGHELRIDHRIIANPNCSTIQMVLALSSLHKKYKIRRIVVSTYQAVTGTGKKAVDQLMNERKGVDGPMAYPYRIDFNVLPQVDIFLDNGYTKEEMKMVNETKKILGDSGIQVTATTVRVPVLGGHSEAVNVEFYSDYTLDEVRSLLKETPGVVVMDDPANKVYPMPIVAEGKDEVFVGRLRRDDTQPNTLNMWIVSDNLRKGAATNAVQIAEYMVKHSLIY
ncbi:MAG TPA: aspartate-semialdehyde dehydrogenase [Cyclobacteriaceae bacterium]|nr:aspartate-semialdehyde dehydrogenase [Cyclobacteriaceae bacterium]